MTHRSICFPDFPAVSRVRRYLPPGLIEVRNNSGHISQKVYSRSFPDYDTEPVMAFSAT